MAVNRSVMARRCSTPFGIVEDRGHQAQLVLPMKIVLNAFRHRGRSRPAVRLQADRAEGVLNAFRHRGRSRWGQPWCKDPYGKCSTPFGIVEDRGSSFLPEPSSRSWCSTPFGIVEDRGSPTLDAFEQPNLCSTPFGIVEDRGSRRRPWRPPDRCAQRLSASWKIAVACCATVSVT